MKKLSKKLLVVILILATLITTPSVSAFAQVAQEDEQMQYKQYEIGKEDVYKKYDLVNSWLKTEEAQESIKDKWGIVGTKQDKYVKDKALYYFWGGWVDYSKGYKVNYYTTKSDYSKADQKYLPKVSVTQKNGIITVKFKNLKNYAKKLKSEGLISATDYQDFFWYDICFQTTKGVTNGLYGYIDKLLIGDSPDNASGVGSWGAYGKIIKAKKWEYVQIDTRYGFYKGKVDFNVVMPLVGFRDNIYNYASEQFGLSNLDTCTSVCRTWGYVALSTTVNCKFDKSKTLSRKKVPVIPNTGKFKKS